MESGKHSNLVMTQLVIQSHQGYHTKKIIRIKADNFNCGSEETHTSEDVLWQ